MNLEAVVEELKRMKQEGQGTVYLADETVSLIRDLAAKSSHAGLGNFAPPVAGTAKDAKAVDLVAMVKEHAPKLEKEAAKKAASPGDDVDEKIPEPPVIELPAGDKQTQWNWLRERVLNCPVCNEHARIAEGMKVVFGVGDIDADIFFCGEAPGADEEEQGEPFVGPAGALLTKIIGAMGLKREDVYIGNIMNWRPQKPNMDVGNRPPTMQEMAFCLPYLKAQLAVVQPKVIVALGNTAVKGLLGNDPNRRMGDVRGRWHDFEGTPLMIIYHPSYLLRNDTLQTKRVVWEDMLLVMEKVGLSINDKQRGYFLKR